MARQEALVTSRARGRYGREERVRRLARAYCWVVRTELANGRMRQPIHADDVHEDALATALVMVEREHTGMRDSDVASVEPLLKRFLARRLNH